MPHVFGRDIEFLFTPIVNGEPVKVHSLVSARIYSSPPSQTAIEDSPSDTSEIEEIATWNSEGDHAKKITFSALADSTPHSSNNYEKFYIVVNFLFQSGGDTKFATETIHVFRPDAWQSRITTNFADVYAIEQTLQQFQNPAEVEMRIPGARESTILALEAKGLERRRLFNLERLNRAVAYRVLADYYLDQLSEGTPGAEKKFDLYLSMWQARVDNAGAGYDVDDDDDPDANETVQAGSYVTFIR